MPLINVARTELAISAGQPTGITALSTKAEIVDAYEAMTGFTTTVECLITALPQPQRDWNVSQDAVTVCANQNTSALRKQFKVDQTAPNTTIAGLMDYTDPFIAAVWALQESASQVGTYRITHPNGTDKVWGQVQVKSVIMDPTDNESRVLFSSEWFYEALPIWSAI